jgi:hypothetical protein
MGKLKYELVKAVDAYLLTVEISKRLSEGYSLHGDVKIVEKGDGEFLFFQAIISPTV